MFYHNKTNCLVVIGGSTYKQAFGSAETWVYSIDLRQWAVLPYGLGFESASLRRSLGDAVDWPFGGREGSGWMVPNADYMYLLTGYGYLSTEGAKPEIWRLNISLTYGVVPPATASNLVNPGVTTRYFSGDFGGSIPAIDAAVPNVTVVDTVGPLVQYDYASGATPMPYAFGQLTVEGRSPFVATYSAYIWNNSTVASKISFIGFYDYTGWLVFGPSTGNQFVSRPCSQFSGFTCQPWSGAVQGADLYWTAALDFLPGPNYLRFYLSNSDGGQAYAGLWYSLNASGTAHAKDRRLLQPDIVSATPCFSSCLIPEPVPQQNGLLAKFSEYLATGSPTVFMKNITSWPSTSGRLINQPDARYCVTWTGYITIPVSSVGAVSSFLVQKTCYGLCRTTLDIVPDVVAAQLSNGVTRNYTLTQPVSAFQLEHCDDFPGSMNFFINGSGYGGGQMHTFYTQQPPNPPSYIPPPVAPPVAPPVLPPAAPPAAPPVTPPTAPPVAPAPTQPPIQAPEASPFSPPAQAPLAPPLAAPTAPPVAPPSSQPATPPQLPPVLAPVASAPQTVPVAAPTNPMPATPVPLVPEQGFAAPAAPVDPKSITNEPTPLSGGGIAGVVIAVVAIAVIGVALVFYFAVLPKRRKAAAKAEVPMAQLPPESPRGTQYAAPPSAIDVELGGQFDPKWIIDWSLLELGTKLGSGAFGLVLRGTYSGEPVAIKQCLLNVGPEALDDFKREAKLMLSIKSHPSIVHVYGLCVHDGSIYLVMELCEGGSLDKKLKKGALSAAEKLGILQSVARGVAHLHKQQVVHRDLAARNVLLTENLKAKVSGTIFRLRPASRAQSVANDSTPWADLGMSRIVDKFTEKHNTASNVGPIRWMAPESIRSREYSFATDCWSWAVVATEVWSQSVPFPDADLITRTQTRIVRTDFLFAKGLRFGVVALEIRDHGKTPDIPEDMPEWLAELLQRCWSQDQLERPSMHEIVKAFKEHEKETE